MVFARQIPVAVRALHLPTFFEFGVLFSVKRLYEDFPLNQPFACFSDPHSDLIANVHTRYYRKSNRGAPGSFILLFLRRNIRTGEVLVFNL